MSRPFPLVRELSDRPGEYRVYCTGRDSSSCESGAFDNWEKRLRGFTIRGGTRCVPVGTKTYRDRDRNEQDPKYKPRSSGAARRSRKDALSGSSVVAGYEKLRCKCRASSARLWCPRGPWVVTWELQLRPPKLNFNIPPGYLGWIRSRAIGDLGLRSVG